MENTPDPRPRRRDHHQQAQCAEPPLSCQPAGGPPCQERCGGHAAITQQNVQINQPFQKKFLSYLDIHPSHLQCTILVNSLKIPLLAEPFTHTLTHIVTPQTPPRCPPPYQSIKYSFTGTRTHSPFLSTSHVLTFF